MFLVGGGRGALRERDGDEIGEVEEEKYTRGEIEER